MQFRLRLKKACAGTPGERASMNEAHETHECTKCRANKMHKATPRDMNMALDGTPLQLLRDSARIWRCNFLMLKPLPERQSPDALASWTPEGTQRANPPTNLCTPCAPYAHTMASTIQCVKQTSTVVVVPRALTRDGGEAGRRRPCHAARRWNAFSNALRRMQKSKVYLPRQKTSSTGTSAHLTRSAISSLSVKPPLLVDPSVLSRPLSKYSATTRQASTLAMLYGPNAPSRNWWERNQSACREGRNEG